MTDSGVKPGKEGFDRTGTDTVWTYNTKTVAVRPLLKGKDLFEPNGLCADAEGVWVVTLGANELFHVSAKGEKGPSTNLPKGALDGIVKLDDGSMLVSSWEASKIYRGVPGGTFEALVEGVESPADIGFDTKRQRVLIPIFKGDAVNIQSLPQLAPLAVPAPAAAEPAKAETPAKPAATPPAQQKPAATPPAAKPASSPAPAPAPASKPAKPATHLPPAASVDPPK